VKWRLEFSFLQRPWFRFIEFMDQLNTKATEPLSVEWLFNHDSDQKRVDLKPVDFDERVKGISWRLMIRCWSNLSGSNRFDKQRKSNWSVGWDVERNCFNKVLVWNLRFISLVNQSGRFWPFSSQISTRPTRFRCPDLVIINLISFSVLFLYRAPDSDGNNWIGICLLESVS